MVSESNSVSTVWEVATQIVKYYGDGKLHDSSNTTSFHEATLLMLNINKAKTRLGWHPRLNLQQCIELVVDWYKRYKTEDVYHLCLEEINIYTNVGSQKNS